MPDAAPVEKPEDVKYTLLNPGDKTSEVVREGERNPFVKAESELLGQDAKGTNEENEIRDRIARLRVVGVSPGTRGLRVMLGDMILEPGLMVPQVLADQTVHLRVGTITPQYIELVWVEKKPTGLPARVLTIPVDLRPSVRYVLNGQPTESNQWEKGLEDKDSKVGPVGRQFPDVAQSPASMPSTLAQNDRSGTGQTAAAVPAPPAAAPVPLTTDAPAEVPKAEPVPDPVPPLQPLPAIQDALELLEKLVPLDGGQKK